MDHEQLNADTQPLDEYGTSNGQASLNGHASSNGHAAANGAAASNGAASLERTCGMQTAAHPTMRPSDESRRSRTAIRRVGGRRRRNRSQLHQLREARRRQGLSVRCVAQRLNMSVGEVRAQEEEQADILLSELYRWQSVLEVPLEELLNEPQDTLSPRVLMRARMLRVMKTARALARPGPQRIGTSAGQADDRPADRDHAGAEGSGGLADGRSPPLGRRAGPDRGASDSGRLHARSELNRSEHQAGDGIAGLSSRRQAEWEGGRIPNESNQRRRKACPLSFRCQFLLLVAWIGQQRAANPCHRRTPRNYSPIQVSVVLMPRRSVNLEYGRYFQRHWRPSARAA